MDVNAPRRVLNAHSLQVVVVVVLSLINLNIIYACSSFVFKLKLNAAFGGCNVGRRLEVSLVGLYGSSGSYEAERNVAFIEDIERCAFG